MQQTCLSIPIFVPSSSSTWQDRSICPSMTLQHNLRQASRVIQSNRLHLHPSRTRHVRHLRPSVSMELANNYSTRRILSSRRPHRAHCSAQDLLRRLNDTPCFRHDISHYGAPNQTHHPPPLQTRHRQISR